MGDGDGGGDSRCQVDRLRRRDARRLRRRLLRHRPPLLTVRRIHRRCDRCSDQRRCDRRRCDRRRSDRRRSDRHRSDRRQSDRRRSDRRRSDRRQSDRRQSDRRQSDRPQLSTGQRGRVGCGRSPRYKTAVTLRSLGGHSAVTQRSHSGHTASLAAVIQQSQSGH